MAVEQVPQQREREAPLRARLQHERVAQQRDVRRVGERADLDRVRDREVERLVELLGRVLEEPAHADRLQPAALSARPAALAQLVLEAGDVARTPGHREAPHLRVRDLPVEHFHQVRIARRDGAGEQGVGRVVVGRFLEHVDVGEEVVAEARTVLVAESDQRLRAMQHPAERVRRLVHDDEHRQQRDLDRRRVPRHPVLELVVREVAALLVRTPADHLALVREPRVRRDSVVVREEVGAEELEDRERRVAADALGEHDVGAVELGLHFAVERRVGDMGHRDQHRDLAGGGIRPLAQREVVIARARVRSAVELDALFGQRLRLALAAHGAAERAKAARDQRRREATSHRSTRASHAPVDDRSTRPTGRLRPSARRGRACAARSRCASATTAPAARAPSARRTRRRTRAT